jgi:two-component system LytT family sensor kinase
MNQPARTRRSIWWWYSAAWIPIMLGYIVPMWTTARFPGSTIANAVIQSVSHWLTPALLGVVVWWLTSKVHWPPRSMWRFAAMHGAVAVLFSTVWLLADVSFILLGTRDLSATLFIVRSFQGFQFFDGLFVYAMMAATSHVVRIAGRLRAEEARAARADALRMQAELAALRGQLNPHFLFNTLHTLTALVRRDPDTAEQALERFGEMLRYVLDVKRSAREDVTLQDEMQFVRNYLALEKLRLGERLRVVERIDPDALDVVLPSLTLQPLVENAIKYGIAPRSSGGTLEIIASFVGESLELEVRDDGPGTQSDVIDVAKGVGLRAVRQRLETRYRGASGFAVNTAPGKGFALRLVLPAHALTAAN